MTIAPNDLLIVDTNVLVHWIRQDRTGEYLRLQYQLEQRPERPLYSTISEGEALGLAKYWDWGERKIEALKDLLNELVRLEASIPDVIEAYAELYCDDQRNGWNTGENDLWIAACARATSSVLLTCDADFLRVPSAMLRVEHVPAIN